MVQVYGILLRHSACVQALSCDEAYLDVTGAPGYLLAQLPCPAQLSFLEVLPRWLAWSACRFPCVVMDCSNWLPLRLANMLRCVALSPLLRWGQPPPLHPLHSAPGLGDPEQLAATIRAEIAAATGCTGACCVAARLATVPHLKSNPSAWHGPCRCCCCSGHLCCAVPLPGAASAGIGPNPLLARIATDHAKPNGQLAVTQAAAAQYLQVGAPLSSI